MAQQEDSSPSFHFPDDIQSTIDPQLQHQTSPDPLILANKFIPDVFADLPSTSSSPRDVLFSDETTTGLAVSSLVSEDLGSHILCDNGQWQFPEPPPEPSQDVGSNCSGAIPTIEPSHSSPTQTIPALPHADDVPNAYYSANDIRSLRISSLDDLPDGIGGNEAKPGYSYAMMIRFAILGSPEKRLTLEEIYQTIENRWPYYRTAGKGWKNSVRHNLSLNKAFVRKTRDLLDPGKGAYWTVDEVADPLTPGSRKLLREGGRKTTRPSKKSKGLPNSFVPDGDPEHSLNIQSVFSSNLVNNPDDIVIPQPHNGYAIP